MPKIRISTLNTLREQGEKIACLTAYDATFARVLCEAGVDVILVGDTLGMILQGHSSTIPVTVTDIAYHTRAVSQGNTDALLIADMPFMSYATTKQALKHATTLMQAGAEMIKLEGGTWLSETIRRLTECGIPVCAHLGLTPQSVHKLSGFKVQGRLPKQAQQLLEDAKTLEAAGASLLVLECVPMALAAKITEELHIPTIGIGAGPDCSGQILVLYDMLGISAYQKLRFTRNFLLEPINTIQDAIKAYVQAVKEGHFPNLEHGFE